MMLVAGWSIAVHAEPPATAPAKGTVAGVVTYNGQVVDHAMVRLIKPQPAGQRRAAQARPAEPATDRRPATAPARNRARGANRAQPVAIATTDANGKFTIEDVAPGDYAVAVALRGLANGRTRVHVTAGQTVNVTVQLRERATGQRPQL
jgi:hypothetical protein